MMLLFVVVALLTQFAIMGLLLWVVRAFGAFARTCQALYNEVTLMRDENRRLRELNDTLTRQKSA